MSLMLNSIKINIILQYSKHLFHFMPNFIGV